MRIPGSFDWDRPQQDVPARTGVGLGRVARVRERPRPRGPADDDREKSIEASTRGPTSRPLARGCPSASARAEGGSLRFVEVGGILVDLFSRHVGLWGSGQGRGGGDLVLVHGCGEGGHRPRFPSGPCRAGRADTERILRAGAERDMERPYRVSGFTSVSERGVVGARRYPRARRGRPREQARTRHRRWTAGDVAAQQCRRSCTLGFRVSADRRLAMRV